MSTTIEDARPDESPVRGTLSKVPAVPVAFWNIKICATTVGETSGDALSCPEPDYVVGRDCSAHDHSHPCDEQETGDPAATFSLRLLMSQQHSAGDRPTQVQRSFS
ncbi:MAG TPA: hypothetical protein VGQ21_11790 [Thermoanaerobaculia bacterium]|jgi:hypothetical protein|nr:hypothetical protein [Thermoanaerobaculia bacterium]